MKVYQIVDRNNPISDEYANISRESFQPLIDDGTLEFIDFPAITPDHPDFEDIIAQYEWKISLMAADRGSYEDHSPTEKAGMCSHWELMRQQGESEERFLIMEHDSYLIHEQVFRDMLEYIEEHKVCYANIGLFMGCYTYSTHCAKWMYELLNDQKFWINGGPYSVVERLFRNYTDHYLRKRNYLDIEHTVIHPWHACDTLGFGRRVDVFFNSYDMDRQNSIKTPTTQVVSKRLKVTQDHHRYKKKFIDEPWTRWPTFKVID